jgi:hypothetical protein
MAKFVIAETKSEDMDVIGLPGRTEPRWRGELGCNQPCMSPRIHG